MAPLLRPGGEPVPSPVAMAGPGVTGRGRFFHERLNTIIHRYCGTGGMK